MRRFGHSVFFLADQTFRSLVASTAFARLMELVSREEAAAPGNGDGRGRVSLPDLEYRSAIPAGDPVPMVAPRHIRAWQVQWKTPSRSSGDGLGYRGVGGFYLPRATGDALALASWSFPSCTIGSTWHRERWPGISPPRGSPPWRCGAGPHFWIACA